MANWVKVVVDMPNDPKIKIIDGEEDNNLIHYIWMRSILLAGKCNKDGKLYINDNLKYTIKTLAIEFNRTVEEVKRAFSVLRKLEMIEITENNEYSVKNWAKNQNTTALDKIRKQTNERVARYRERKREEKLNDTLDNENIEQEELEDNENTPEECTNNDVENNSKDTHNNSNLKLIDSQTANENLNNTTKNCNNNTGVTSNGENSVTKLSVTKKNLSKRENNKIKKKIKDIDIDRESMSLSPVELMIYVEKVTGKVGIVDIGALTLAANSHNSENVKKAIDKAIEVGKVNMPYINGILQNWKREGYPKDIEKEGVKFDRGVRGFGTKDSDKFKSIKPKKCRELGEEERRKAEEMLI